MLIKDRERSGFILLGDTCVSISKTYTKWAVLVKNAQVQTCHTDQAVRWHCSIPKFLGNAWHLVTTDPALFTVSTVELIVGMTSIR
jgi:hypothetical protein